MAYGDRGRVCGGNETRTDHGHHAAQWSRALQVDRRLCARLVLGDAVPVYYCLAGIGVIISESLLLFSVIKWAGAACLIYVGVQFLRA